MKHTEQRFNAVSTAVKTRVEKFNGRKHIVVPVVALVEGVIQAMNAGNPEFVAAEEFEKAPVGWNGRPVFVDHPVQGGTPVFGNQPSVLEKKQIGIVFNAASAKGKLTMEAWIDVDRARELEPELLERIEAGEPIEISVGLLCNTSDEQGKFNGKAYKGAWKDLIPDHLALLSKGHIGACSREMGCGVRAALGNGCNQHGCPGGAGSVEEKLKAKNKLEADLAKERQEMGRKKIDKTLGGVFARLMSAFRGTQAASDMNARDLLMKLDQALRKVEPTLSFVETYLPVLEPNRVIYTCYHELGSMMYERSFSLAANGEVTVGPNAIEVEPVLYYEPILMSEYVNAEEAKAAIGKRNSAKDQARVQAMHNYALELGASCGDLKAACGCGGHVEEECKCGETLPCGHPKAAVGNGCNQYGCPDGAGGGGSKDGPSKTNPTAGLNESDKKLVSDLTHDVLEDFAPDSITGDDIIAIEDAVEKGETITEAQGDLLADALEDWAGNEFDDIHEDDDEERNSEREKEANKVMDIVKKIRGAQARTTSRVAKRCDLRDLLRAAEHKFVK